MIRYRQMRDRTMKKIGQFIYPWGNGHYTRMMRLNEVLADHIREDIQIHISTKPPIYEKILAHSRYRAHNILMPTPIDGRFGPSVWRSLLNLLLPVEGNPPLVRQIACYLREEGRLYNREHFDIVINDGDMGSNIIASRRNVPSLFVTNQFKPRLWRSRFYFYPAVSYVARQIARASQILVADSAPPYTMCEYNLNLPDSLKGRVSYVGHFTGRHVPRGEPTDLERLIADAEFGYWMRTGNRSTNDGTGSRYRQIFAMPEMAGERRIVSHARDDPAIDCVTGRDKRRYSVSEALEGKVDWIQIDIGFLSEQEKESVLERCLYAVINGSHTVMGEILGGKSKPVIGIPIYDEHTNQLRWAQERNLGILARNARQAVEGIRRIRSSYATFQEAPTRRSRFSTSSLWTFNKALRSASVTLAINGGTGSGSFKRVRSDMMAFI